MQLILTVILLQSLGVWAEFVKVYVRDVTYAATCTYYNTITVAGPNLLGTSLYTSTCTSPLVSGPYVTQACFTGVGLLGAVISSCSLPVTATACTPSTTTRVSTTAPVLNLLGITLFPGGTGTTTVTTSACSTAVFAPNPLQPAAGTVCYADSVGARSLSGPSTSSNTMTNAACRTFCTNLGYPYSGTEYSSECYCGNALPTVTSSSCNMACSVAGSTEICGGSNALSVSTNSALATTNSAGSALLASWFSKGCYSDNYPSRILSSSTASSSALTLEACITFCNNGGFSLAGVEYGQECYCANALQSDGATYGVPVQSGCTYPCSGRSSQTCGGPNVLNLYSKTAATPPVAAGPAPVPSPSAGTYSYVACYADQNGGRTLAINKSPINSVEACVTACSNSGYRYAGVEYRNECWCDNAIRTGTAQIAASNCLLPCAGTPSQTCGGSNAIQIYMGAATGGPIVPPTSAGYNYVDSYIDSSSARILPFQQTLSNYTVGNCVRACSNLGYAFAGLEFGQQCFCGTTRLNNPPGGQTPNIPCTGNAAQFCGGSSILQVYTGTPSPQPLTSSFGNGQCVADNTNNVRTLSVSMGTSSTMTPAACRSLCVGYTYFGVEYGSECWCDNTFATGSVMSTVCTMTCSGDNMQFCGGSYALNMYRS
ncbi:uncharacterized protein RAG0_04170 [Rhynchosporium agropyri]|uniref:WSC domain-containing protein n=1 Tax=Rhynchosporium agropyri TaxID=914238 RepID=A0A1E1K7R3_9HELO|nr:uncharacterized protein RAG0_04170 [Rhynchosporium agropyri]